MGWERGRYYTRSRRLDGRVVREYLGHGPEADAAAAEVQLSARERAIWKGEQERALALERTLDGFDRACTLAFHAALAVAGYRQHHRGEWRKQRHD